MKLESRRAETQEVDKTKMWRLGLVFLPDLMLGDQGVKFDSPRTVLEEKGIIGICRGSWIVDRGTRHLPLPAFCF